MAWNIQNVCVHSLNWTFAFVRVDIYGGHLTCNLPYDRWRLALFHLVSNFDFIQANILTSNLCKSEALHFTRKVKICGPPWRLFQGMCVERGEFKKGGEIR